MEKLAFISRHQPPTEQVSIAATMGYKLVCVGDRDAFTLDPSEFKDFFGAVVVHPAAALRLIRHMPVGIFENGLRSEEGGKPTFFARALHMYPE